MGIEKNLRKEKRIPIKIALTLNGKTDKGFPINSQITTENVSKSGICFKINTPLIHIKPGDRINGELKNYKFQSNCTFIIVWKKGSTLGGYLEQEPNNWFVT